jgi:quercetin dioxygenase-like cupin family protein
MIVKNIDDVPKFKLEMEGAKNVFKQIPISSKDGTPAYSFRVFTVKPGGNTPFHKHPYEHLNYIISGKGVLVGKEGERPISKGDFALVMPNEPHSYKNTSDTEDLVLICAVKKEFE